MTTIVATRHMMAADSKTVMFRGQTEIVNAA